MIETDLWMMTALIFSPALGAVAVLLVPRGRDELARWVGLLGAAVPLALSVMVLTAWRDAHQEYPAERGVKPMSSPASSLEARVDSMNAARAVAPAADGTSKGGNPGRSNDWVARVPWVERFGIDYFLGVDGLSLSLVLVTTVIVFLSAVAAWEITKSVKGFFALLLLLETGVLGCFLALDFFLFYVFWEVMLVPMYFLIGVWGGPRREYAAVKFFLYTLVGSVLILVALLALYFTDVRGFVPEGELRERAVAYAVKERGYTVREAELHWREFTDKVGVNTFDLVTLAKAGRGSYEVIAARQKLSAAEAADAGVGEARETFTALERKYAVNGQAFFTPAFQLVTFALLFVGFAIKIPMVPFHTWLPDAHVEAPTPVSMVLAGVLLKLGGYGILRIAYPVCPWAAEYLAYPLALMGVVSIVYGAFAAMAQTDFKRLVAYSSVSHMGYVILGVAAWSGGARSQYWADGMNGALFQMVAHGVTSAGMFFLVGVAYGRTGTRDLNHLRGLLESMPVFGAIGFILFFAAMGLPGLCGFLGEFLVLLAAWNYDKGLATVAAFTAVVTAAYILWTLQRVFLGVNPAHQKLSDLTPRELVVLVPLAVLAVALGVAPNLLLSWAEPSVTGIVDVLARLGGK